MRKVPKCGALMMKLIWKMRPRRIDDKYWTGTRNFDHIQYESDLEDYISDLEAENEQLKSSGIGSKRPSERTIRDAYKAGIQWEKYQNREEDEAISEDDFVAACASGGEDTVAERGKFTCYEIHTVQARMYGCSEQCDECAARSSREGQP